ALQAKLSEIERDAQALDDLVRQVRGSYESEAASINQEASQASSLNVYRRLDLELKFQGVDFGGILSRVFDWLTLRQALQITVAEQANNAIVSGALRPDGRAHVYANVSKDNERIVAAVAYSKLRDHLIAQQSGFQNLDWEDIELLHKSVLALADLRARSE